ncbi:MAG: hypothetical protein Q4F40_07915 [Akkermansia sp.]|nr:hypothetical protein [Akkermansia sp.]
MKPNVLSSAVILSALTATAALATEGADDAPIYLDKTAITLDAGYMMDIDNLSVDHLTGASIGMSYIFNRTEKSAHSIGLSFGYFDGSESETYAPYLSERIEYPAETIVEGYLIPLNVVEQSQYSPSQKISQKIIPVILTYKYHRNITDSLSANVGVRAGVYVSQTSAKTRIGSETLYNFYLAEETYGIPAGTQIAQDVSSGCDTGKSSHTSISPTIGLEIGMEYKFAKNWSWNLSASVDASFCLDREVPCMENSKGAEWAAAYAETSKETAVSATIRTGFSYQF